MTERDEHDDDLGVIRLHQDAGAQGRRGSAMAPMYAPRAQTQGIAAQAQGFEDATRVHDSSARLPRAPPQQAQQRAPSPLQRTPALNTGENQKTKNSRPSPGNVSSGRSNIAGSMETIGTAFKDSAKANEESRTMQQMQQMFMMQMMSNMAGGGVGGGGAAEIKQIGQKMDSLVTSVSALVEFLGSREIAKRKREDGDELD